ncbi:hypothetical protein EC991_009907 [Linnemannia zychae]|nr:hypothetical protein EC991_009907 [Linnemannia zychae]
MSAGLLRARGVRTLSGPRFRAPRFLQLQLRPLKVLCAIDNTKGPFQVEIEESDTVLDLQMKIKLAKPNHLPQDADTLSLYRAPEGVGLTEPDVTVRQVACIKYPGAFHGREHLPDYKSLFEFDFAAVNRSQDKKVAEHRLNLMLNESIMQFYRAYDPYLGMSADYLIGNFINDDATASLRACVNVVRNTLASVRTLEDPLSRIREYV